MDESNEWELSKENVQPLRQGRKMASLTAGLQPQNEQRIRNERHVFETELRTYTGDDPVDTWYKYIRWAEQTFPKGGVESHLTSIVERCVRQFKDEEKYRNDERYIYAWMKMADICNEPLEIYSFMYDHNIGCELSSFYIGWATLYEEFGNVKKADAVYLKGKRNNARPFEILVHRHEEFEKRVARKIVEGQEFSDQEESNFPESWGQVEGQAQRQVFSQLRTSGKKHLVPVNRTGNAIAGTAGVLSGARLKPTQQVPTGIQIYQDENQTPSSLPPQTNEWKSVPKRDVSNKENEKKAGVWTKQKLGNRGLNIPISSVSTYRQPNFTVHVDETDASLRTPIKKPELDQQVLSSRKEKPTSTVDYLRSMTANPNNNEKPMYCKEKIYGGVEEFSFEELRAFKWKKEMDRKKQEEESREIENSRQRLEEERRLLLEESERVQNERLKIQQQEQALIEYSRRKLQEQRLRIEQEGQKELERHQEVIEQTIERRIQQQLSNSNSLPRPFEDSQLRNSQSTENIHPEMMAGLHISQSSLNTSKRTPNSDSAMRSNPSSSERSDQAMFGSASPTVNTKEALMLVRGMFNSSLETNKSRIDEETAMDQDDAGAIHSAGQNPGKLPFQIFDENAGRSDIQKSKPSVTPFQINDETKENRQENLKKEVPFRIFQEAVRDESSPSRHTQTPMVTSPYSTVNPLTDKPSRQTDSHLQRQSRRTAALFDEDNTVSIESHARDDITLAPLGSHLSFAEAAKFVSTPFNVSKVGSGNSSKHFNDESGLEMRAEREESIEQKKENESERSVTSNSAAWPQSLSPIMEGSSEDSGASSKSACQTVQPKHNPNLSTIDGTPGTVEPPEDTMSLLQLKPLAEANTSNTHVIDVTTYLPQELDEKTENFLSMSICLYDPKDPFDVEMKDKILKNLKEPLIQYDNYEQSDNCLPDIRKGSLISLGMQMYKILSKIGEGGFAKVYIAETEDMTFDLSKLSEELHAIKVQEPCQYWEFYICNEVHKRLGALNDPVDIRPAMMNIHKGCFFRNGSCLITDYHPNGTLVDLANFYKKIEQENSAQGAEPVTTYMTIELLHMVEKLHKCSIIHGDIKPDNFLFLQYPKLPDSADPEEVFSGKQRFAQLIDFGQSIDMTKYKAGTTFMTKVTTRCFQCTEMKTNRPWTYQTDYFGLAGTIHVLLFQQYMNVYQEKGEWKMTSKINRHWNTDLWKKLFHILLNVPSCDELPDLSKIRREFEEYFVTSLLHKYNKRCELFNNVISKSGNRNL